jgi:hypothetical protein
MQTELAGWQIEILRLWSANIGRGASKTDILFFRGILEAKEDAISANLQTFLDRKRRIGSAGRAPQICDEGPLLLMQTAFTGVDRPNEDSMVDGRMASSFGDTQSENHALSLLTFPDAFTNMTNRTTVLDQQRHGDHSHTRDALLLNDFDTSTPGLGPNSDCGKQRQLEHVVPGSLSTSHGSICHVSTGGLGVPAISSRRLRDLIDQVVSKKARRGCGSIRGHGHQQGLFKCTLGCGRRFKSSADTFRHEEIVYPQNFWFCLTCGDPNNPAEKHVFTREDKMRQHIRRLNHSININHCRVPDIRTLYPQRCGFCPNVRYQNWKDRCKHLIQHCRKGDFAVNAHSGGVGKLQGSTNGNDDGDDDEDDDDDDSDKSPEDEPDESNEEGNGSSSNGEGPSNIGPKRASDGHDLDQSDLIMDDDDDELYGSFLRDSPGLYQLLSSMRILTPHVVIEFLESGPWICNTSRKEEEFYRQGYNGVHADFKPVDILIPSSEDSSTFEYTFKLVDMALVSFHFETTYVKKPRMDVLEDTSITCKFDFLLPNAKSFQQLTSCARFIENHRQTWLSSRNRLCPLTCCDMDVPPIRHDLYIQDAQR